jgi:hypothetical protein
MTHAALPSFARRSRIVLAATVLLALLVTVIEVPRATPAIAPAPFAIA